MLARSWSSAGLGERVALLVLCLELVHTQSNEFNPLSIFRQAESVSEDGGAWSSFLGPQGVVILWLAKDQARQSPQVTVGVEGGLLEVRWLAVASLSLTMFLAMRHAAMAANRLREDLGMYRRAPHGGT